MTPSFFKKLGPISSDLIKSSINCKTVNVSKEDYFDCFVSIGDVSNNALYFLYDNEKPKLYAIGDFAISTKEIDIVIQNTNTIKQTYQLKDNLVELNSNIDSTKICSVDMSLSNINFKLKDININKKL